MKLRNAHPQIYKKKAFSYILRHVFCFHFLRVHLDTSSEEALEV